MKMYNILMSNSWSHYEAAVKTADVLQNHGFEAYIIGGAVRDLLLGHLPKDFDIVTNATPDEVLKFNEFKKSYYKDTAQAFGITRVQVEVPSDNKTDLIEVEIATYRRDIEAHLGRKLTKVEFAHLEDDVQRRDLTINALAYDPTSYQLIDLVRGIDDLEQKLIRFIGDPATRIKEDPLRILRAVRLKNQLGFAFEPDTKRGLRDAINVVGDIAPERAADELTKMLIHPSRVQAIKDLDELGFLEELIPELIASKGVPQPKDQHSEGDVFTHSVLAMKYLPAKPSKRLAWATLLHDIGKPETIQTKEETGDRIRFSGHHKIGDTLAKQILRRLKFPSKQINDIAWMIHYHMGIDDLPNMTKPHQIKFMSHDAFEDLLELHKADAHASWNKKNGHIDKSAPDFSGLEDIWHDFKNRTDKKVPSLKKDLGIDGAWLMQEFGLKKGKQLGQVLQKLEQAYLDEELKTKSDAKLMVRSLLSEF